mmetsp:Transcript_70273/g.164579  ORF Transcript_70273/g.164579 Transcript_70273/m.164579 type:complete len:212 (-) Transcript_70273:31-666(-)
MDLNDWRATVARDWTRIKDAPAKVRGDRVAGLAAVRQSAEALNYLERSLQTDRQVVLTAIAAHHRPREVGPRPGHEFLETATETVEDLTQLSNAAFDLGYSAMRLTEVVCRELVNSSASLAQGATSAWNTSDDTQESSSPSPRPSTTAEVWQRMPTRRRSVSAAGSRRRKAPDSRSACGEGGLWQRSSSRAGVRDRRSLFHCRADSMSSAG